MFAATETAANRIWDVRPYRSLGGNAFSVSRHTSSTKSSAYRYTTIFLKSIAVSLPLPYSMAKITSNPCRVSCVLCPASCVLCPVSQSFASFTASSKAPSVSLTSFSEWL